METKLEHVIRVVKAAQTQAHAQRLMLIALVGTMNISAPALLEEIYDAKKTAEDHINALQHIIDKLASD